MFGFFGKKKASARLFEDVARRVLSKEITVHQGVGEVIRYKVGEEVFLEVMDRVKYFESSNPRLAYALSSLVYETVVNGDYDDLMKALSMLTLADLSQDMKMYEQSIKLYENCLTTFRLLSDRFVPSRPHPGEGLALGNLGIVYGQLHNHRKARDHLESALNISREVGDRKNERRWLHNLGNVYVGLEDYEKAIKYYEQTLALSVLFSDKLAEEMCLGELGAHVYAMIGEYYKARECHEKALKISRQINDRVGEATQLGDLGRVHMLLGNHQGAIECLEQALDICRRIGQKELESDQLRFLGTAYLNTGEFERSMKYYSQALEVSEEVSDKRCMGSALSDLVNFYLTLGDLEKGEEYLRQALKVAEEVGTRRSLARLLGGFALTSSMMGKHARARDFVEQALRISKETADIKGESNWLGVLGNLHRLSGDVEKAIELHEQALTISSKIGDRIGQMTQLCGLGIDYRVQGQYLKARDMYEEAIGIAKTIGNVEGHRVALANLGILYADYLKDSEKAYTSLATAIDLLEEMRSSIVSEEYKITFLGERVDVYSKMILLCIAMGKKKQAFEYAERARSRALVDLIGNRRIDPKTTDEKELVEEAERLRCIINRLRKEQENIPPEVEEGRSLSGEQARKISEAEKKEINIWNKIKRKNPEYTSLRQVDPITLEETQEILHEKSALIEYYITPEKTVAFLVTKKGLRCETLDFSQKDVWQILLDPITKEVREPSIENRALISDLLAELFNMLFAPLKEHIENNGVERICFSPHGLLHLFPFHAMYEDTAEGRRYVIQDYVVSYTPSASVLRYCMQKRYEGESLFAVKNPDGSLKYADSEVEEMSKLFGSKIILGREDGTRENVLSRARGHSLVHFACHGQFRGDIPQQSGVRLADGWLTMIDIFNNLELDANLVTLSACQTGKSKPEGGDEVIGLTRALLYAGAPSVIASLWRVDDKSTGILFQRFYAYLKQGDDKAEALQKAQIDTMGFRREGALGRPFSHPYFWAPFCLVGDWRPL